MSWFHKVRLRLLGGFLRLLFLCVNSAEAAEDGSGYESSAGHGHAGPASGTHRQHSPVCLFVFSTLRSRVLQTSSRVSASSPIP